MEELKFKTACQLKEWWWSYSLLEVVIPYIKEGSAKNLGNFRVFLKYRGLSPIVIAEGQIFDFQEQK